MSYSGFELYRTIYKLKNDIKTPFFLGEDKSIWLCIEAVRAFSCYMRGLKQREQASTSPLHKKKESITYYIQVMDSFLFFKSKHFFSAFIKYRSCCILHSSDLYVEKLKRIYIVSIKNSFYKFFRV